jgi:hypothetical protein
MTLDNFEKELIKKIRKKYPNHSIIILLYDSEGDVIEFGYGCERCASDILYVAAKRNAAKPHNKDYFDPTIN